MTPEQKSKYTEKAKSSFKTKLDLYIFSKVITNAEESISEVDFKDFFITENLKKIYITKYWQWYNDSKIKEISAEIDHLVTTESTIKDIYFEMQDLRRKIDYDFRDLEKNYVESYHEIFPEEEFEKLLEGDCCHYCQITSEKINELIDAEKLFKKHPSRGWSLEIARKDSNLEYTPENSVICCYWCSNAKTDEFTEEEFLKVGKAIQGVWNDRLGKGNVEIVAETKVDDKTEEIIDAKPKEKPISKAKSNPKKIEKDKPKGKLSAKPKVKTTAKPMEKTKK